MSIPPVDFNHGLLEELPTDISLQTQVEQRLAALVLRLCRA